MVIATTASWYRVTCSSILIFPTALAALTALLSIYLIFSFFQHNISFALSQLKTRKIAFDSEMQLNILATTKKPNKSEVVSFGILCEHTTLTPQSLRETQISEKLCKKRKNNRKLMKLIECKKMGSSQFEIRALSQYI